jgi:hypothetical protein
LRNSWLTSSSFVVEVFFQNPRRAFSVHNGCPGAVR